MRLPCLIAFPANEVRPIYSDHLHPRDWAEPNLDSLHRRKQEIPFHDAGHQIRIEPDFTRKSEINQCLKVADTCKF